MDFGLHLKVNNTLGDYAFFMVFNLQDIERWDGDFLHHRKCRLLDLSFECSCDATRWRNGR